MVDTDLGTRSLVRAGSDIGRDLLPVLTRELLESKIFNRPGVARDVLQSPL